METEGKIFVDEDDLIPSVNLYDEVDAFDPVLCPRHYPPIFGVEPLDIIEELNMPHHLACVLKYIWRYPMKGGIEDLKKAEHYLSRYIQKMEREHEA